MIGIIIFFLVSIHLAIGMLASMLLVSPRALGPRFFRFNAAISLALLALAQGAYLFYISPEPTSSASVKALFWRSHLPTPSILLWAVLGITLVYTLSLPFKKVLLSRFLLFLVSGLGFASLAMIGSALSHRAVSEALAFFVFPANFFLSALILGSVMICMILGHWYLVEPGMSVKHLQKVAGLFIGAVVGRVLLGAYMSVLIWRDLAIESGDPFSNLFLVNLLFVGQRILFGLLLPLALSWMIWQTVKIRSTQSATGILYVAVVFVLFGEFLSLYILVSTGYPL